MPNKCILQGFGKTVTFCAKKRTKAATSPKPQMQALHFNKEDDLEDLNVLMPVITMAGMMFIILLGLAALFKSFYRKVPPGEVMVVNSLKPNPLFVRTGALVYPIIHSASNVSLNVMPIDIENDLKDLFDELFALKISSLSVQVVDSEESILKAQKRISLSDVNERHNQLSSVVNVAVRGQIKTSTNLEALKNNVNETLSKIGYELVI